MQIDVSSIPDEGKELVYQEDPFAIQLSPDIEIRGEVKVKAFLYKAGRTVIVKGTIEAEPHLECGRCSVDFFLPLTIAFDQIFVPKAETRPIHQKQREERRGSSSARSRRGEVPEPEEEEEVIDPLVENFYDGSTVVLDEMIREQVHLALPMRPLCSPECKGLCPVCGMDWNKGSCDCPRPEENIPVMKRLFNLDLKKRKGE